MPSRIVTSTYRYKRPPRKRKAVPLEGPAIVRKRRHLQHRKAQDRTGVPPPANDDRKSAIVTAKRRRSSSATCPT